MNFSISLITCPAGKERKEKTQAIITQLHLQPHQIFNDVRRQGLWFNASRAWASADRSKKYHVVIQDDIILCDNFLETVDKIISPDTFNLPIIQLYHNKITDTDSRCEAANFHWIKSPLVTTAQALMIRSDLIHNWLRWCAKNVSLDYRFDDGRLEMWQAVFNTPAYFTFPNIVDHDDDIPSSLGLPRGRRISYLFEPNPLNLDWNFQESSVILHHKPTKGILEELDRYALK